MSEFVNLGLDTGVSGTKVGHKKLMFYLLSLISEGPIREQVNGVFASDYSEDSIDNIAMNTDNGLRYVGNVAKFGKNPWSESGKERYLNQDFMNSMTQAAMSEAKLAGNNPVTVTTALPARWAEASAYLNGQHIPLKEAIVEHYVKTHTIDREGQRGQKSITVDECRILTETQALLYSFLLDKSGEVAIENHKQMRYAVADIGEHTTCFDVFSGLSREGEGFSSEDISMGEVHKSTASQVLALTGRSFSHWEIRDIVKDGGQIMIPAVGKNPAKAFNITAIYNDNVNSLKPVLRSSFASYVNRPDDIHHIIIGGGGSETVGQVLKSTYAQAQIVGQFATLQGLRNYGEKLCKHKNR